MTIDDYGVVRNHCGAKVATFRDRELAERMLGRAALFTEAEAAVIERANESAQSRIKLRAVTMYEVVE